MRFKYAKIHVDSLEDWLNTQYAAGFDTIKHITIYDRFAWVVVENTSA